MTYGRRDLRADCGRCSALCCVVPTLTASADFAIDKPAGRPCPNLGADFRCDIHDDLRGRGFSGCATYDCFGAGQHVTQVVFGGRDWRRDPEIAPSMFAVFPVVRQLRELLWYLAEALTFVPAGALRDELDEVRRRTETMSEATADELAELEPAAHRRTVGVLLARASEATRATVAGSGSDRIRADLVGADLRRVNLAGASLRGALLIKADLRGADLSKTDLLGADLRGSDLSGANLGTSIFLTQPQLDGASGDAGTAIPDELARPRHWRG